MARRRFFVDAIRHGAAELRGDDARHLTRVLRVEAGQRYEISDNRAAYLAEIVEARGERVVFRVIEPVASPELPVRITLLASLIKFDRFEWTIEKATELGVERILPVEAEEQVGPRETLNERIFLGLRSSGLDLAGLRRDHDFEFAAVHGHTIQWLLDEEMAILEGGILRLTPKGFLLCDEICRRLFQ